MKKILVLFLIAIFTINVNGKNRVYTCNEWAFNEIASARLASALLKIKNHDLLFLLLDNPNEKLAIMVKIEPNDDLSMIKISTKPQSFTDKDVDCIFQIIKAEFIKSDTVIRLINTETFYLTNEVDYDHINEIQYHHFNTYYFQRAVKESGAKTHDEKIQALKEWIDKVMKQPIRASSAL